MRHEAMRAAVAMLLLVGAGPATAVAGVPDSLSASLDAQIRAEAARGFTGAVLVVVDGEVVLHRVYGLPTGPDGREPAFWIASNSKPFAAAAILALQDDGRLATGDSLPRFFAGVPRDKRGITLRHLLTHTSGLGHRYLADGVVDRDEAVRRILAAPLVQPIGASYLYSNDGYNLLAAVVEIAAGEPFETYLRARLLQRAGMTRTGFWGHESEIPASVAPLADASRARTMPTTVYRDGASQANWGYRGASGMLSTTEDLYRWMQALRGEKVLSPRARSLLFDPAVPVKGSAYYGYGWGVVMKDGRRYAVNHSGNEDWLGHNGVLWMYEDGDIVIVLSNAGDRDGEGWARVVARGIRERLRP